MITLIACLDMANGIADSHGNLLFNLPKDMKHFKAVTSGKIVVMGRKTWDSLPKKPLEKRKNYVLTRNEEFNPVGAKVIHSINDVIELAKLHDVYVIGGAQVYEQLLPYADKMLLTFVHEFNFNARVFFPDYNPKEWKVTSIKKHEADKKHAYSFTFATLERKSLEK